MKTELFGYEISCRGLAGDAGRAHEHIVAGGHPRYMACANPHSLVVASEDSQFAAALKNADILLPDGTGIVLAARFLKLPIRERVAGSEFFQALTERLAVSGGARYFFLGSSDNVLALIAERLRREYPNIEVCGTYAPPFKEVFSERDTADMLHAVNSAAPDVLWVGMTAPKQEKWIYTNRNRLSVPFVAGIGAVFDFYAGTKKRSSPFWQKIGLEWLPRFLREPRRLWERNLRSTPIFLGWIVREKIRRVYGIRSKREEC